MTTAHLAQTMSLLSLSVDELQQEIESAVASNPALEIVDERRCPHCKRVLGEFGPCPVCSGQAADPNSDEPIIFSSPREDFIPSRSEFEDTLPEENFSDPGEDLQTYVLKQIAVDLAPEDRMIAAHILMNLDDDGLLTIPLVELMQYFRVPMARVKIVQSLIQRADPIGVGSLSPKDALLVQLEILSESQPVPNLAARIIEEDIKSLSRHHYQELARKFNVSVDQIKHVVNFISDNLNPYPGRSHWGSQASTKVSSNQIYHQPDIIVSYLNNKPDNQLVVELVLPIRGTLRVNSEFKELLQDAPEDTKENWKEDLEKAALLVKCINQRENTMERLMQELVALQKQFFYHNEKSLRSITRAQIAKTLEVHESTISRAVANKSLQLPNGRIIPLANLFDRSLNVRTVLCDLIENETKPLSDTDLVELLKDEGFDVARRTVAKYRSMEGILPARLRKKEQ
jgi:RNA polymerase sigma-54 factor